MKILFLLFSFLFSIITNSLYAEELKLICGGIWKFKIINPNKPNQTDIKIFYNNLNDFYKVKLIKSNDDVFIFETKEFLSENCFTEIIAKYNIDRNTGELRKEIKSIAKGTANPKPDFLAEQINFFNKASPEDALRLADRIAKLQCNPDEKFIQVREHYLTKMEQLKLLESSKEELEKYHRSLNVSNCKVLDKKF